MLLNNLLKKSNVFLLHFLNEKQNCLTQSSKEVLIGLIRQYFPKGTAFEKVTDEEIQRVEDKLNTRPRKRLGFKSPYEILTVRNLRAGVAIIS